MGLHVLIFGAIFAVAGYAGGTFPNCHGPILISLVSPGAGSGAGAARGSKPHMNYSRGPVETHQAELPVVPLSMKMNVEIIKASPMVQDKAGVSDAGAGQNAPGTAATSGVTRDPGVQSGRMSPEQWTFIVSALERTKQYPRIARERGMEGVVQLRFRLLPTGDVAEVELVRGSGHEILDTASVRAVYRAAPMPYVTGWIEVPIAYVLK